MRAPVTVVLAFLLSSLAACGGGGEVDRTIESSTTAAPSTTAPPTTATAPPPSAVSTTARPTTTKRPPFPTTTRRPITTTTRPAPTTTISRIPELCAYIRSIDMNAIDPADFVGGFNKIYEGVVGGAFLSTPALFGYFVTIKDVLDRVKPLVDTGQITTREQLAAWALTLDQDTLEKFQHASGSLQLYFNASCK